MDRFSAKCSKIGKLIQSKIDYFTAKRKNKSKGTESTDEKQELECLKSEDPSQASTSSKSTLPLNLRQKVSKCKNAENRAGISNVAILGKTSKQKGLKMSNRSDSSSLTSVMTDTSFILEASD